MKRNGLAERAPLQWHPEQTLESGKCRAEVSTASLDSGKEIRSVRFGRVSNDGRLSQHFHSRDMADLEMLVQSAKALLEG